MTTHSSGGNKDLFERWAGDTHGRYARSQWLLSKWEVVEGVVWPQEKIQVMMDTIIAGLRPAPTDTVLDLGCGGGWILNELRPYFRRCSGLDFSMSMLEQARQLGGTELINGEIGRLPFKDGSFDCVLCYFVFINFLDESYIRSSLQEIGRVLKKGGRALIGQLPDLAYSAEYDRAKTSYVDYCRRTFALGQDQRDHCRIPQKLYDRRAVCRVLNDLPVVYDIRDSFNPFYRPGEPETIRWRFDIFLYKNL